MQDNSVKITVEGDPANIANFFRAVSFYPATTCVAVSGGETDKIPGNYAVMEFERSKMLRDGNPNLFDRK